MTWEALGLGGVAGLLGAQAAAIAAHEHRFGFIGYTVTGLVGGALSITSSPCPGPIMWTSTSI